MDLRSEWKALTRGVPTHVVVQAMNATTPGCNWGGCTKGHMGEAFCGEEKYQPWTARMRAVFRVQLSDAIRRHGEHRAAKKNAAEEQRVMRAAADERDRLAQLVVDDLEKHLGIHASVINGRVAMRYPDARNLLDRVR